MQSSLLKVDKSIDGITHNLTAKVTEENCLKNCRSLRLFVQNFKKFYIEVFLHKDVFHGVRLGVHRKTRQDTMKKH